MHPGCLQEGKAYSARKVVYSFLDLYITFMVSISFVLVQTPCMHSLRKKIFCKKYCTVYRTTAMSADGMMGWVAHSNDSNKVLVLLYYSGSMLKLHIPRCWQRLCRSRRWDLPQNWSAARSRLRECRRGRNWRSQRLGGATLPSRVDLPENRIEYYTWWYLDNTIHKSATKSHATDSY